MRTVYIKAQNCTEGMTLSEDLYADNGVHLISKGTVITDVLEKRIKRFKLKPIRVEIYDDVVVEELTDYETNTQNREMDERLAAAYADAKVEVKDVIDNIYSGKNLENKDVNKAVETVKSAVKDSFDVLKCLDSIKDADEYTYAHCVNVSILAMTIAKWMGLPENQVDEIAKAGLIHDIGKTKISQEILNKQGALDSYEYDEVKKHSTYSYRLIENMDGMTKDIKMAVLMHHEREDGTGYPLGALGDQIHKYAKILAIADVYDAMTSNKVYRQKKSVFKALKEFQDTMYNKLDRVMLDKFIERMVSHYIGDYVILSTGETGQLVHINPRDILRPIVNVDTVYLDLSLENDIELEDLLWDYSKYTV